MSSTLIMPCGGKSSRFTNCRPKWMLTHPNGNLMLMESLYGLSLENINRIIITFIKEHINQYQVKLDKISDDIFIKTSIRPEFLILENFTKSQSETVYQTILKKDVTGSIFIKDCDNYFNSAISEENSVCTCILKNGINAINKSYILTNKFGLVSGIVEKQVISDKFCVGGYAFQDVEDFKKAFEELIHLKCIDDKEIYISHMIQKLLLDKVNFKTTIVHNYEDWGTIEDWKKYVSQFKTIFIDLDGTLVQNSSEYFEPIWGSTKGLFNNIKIINKLYDSGKTCIILTTSRKEEVSTLNQLINLGIKYHKILFNMLHAKRILINDYSFTNEYPSAISINLQRNQDNLEDLLK